MRNVYVREGEFSAAIRGFLCAGSARVETMFQFFLWNYNEIKFVCDARSATMEDEDSDDSVTFARAKGGAARSRETRELSAA